MLKRVAMVLVLLLLVVAAAAEDREVVSPPEFRGQGSDRVPFSPGILVGDVLYASGEIGADLKTREIPADFDAEVRNCLANIRLILKSAGMDFKNVVSVQVYLTDMSRFQQMNKIYAAVFKQPRPARVTVGVNALAVPNAHVEIAVIAHK